VRATVDQGLGYFLQRVDVEPAVEEGQFQGFRIVGLSPPEWWTSVDLKPGDVVTAVNGMPIERDDQAFAAFESLKTANDLKVSYRRGGQPRDLIYKIVDRPARAARSN
jgi:type II secretory pathway component PulC